MNAYTANVLNNCVMLVFALVLLTQLDGWWRLCGLVPLFSIVYKFGASKEDASNTTGEPRK